MDTGPFDDAEPATVPWLTSPGFAAARTADRLWLLSYGDPVLARRVPPGRPPPSGLATLPLLLLGLDATGAGVLGPPTLVTLLEWDSYSTPPLITALDDGVAVVWTRCASCSSWLCDSEPCGDRALHVRTFDRYGRPRAPATRLIAMGYFGISDHVSVAWTGAELLIAIRRTSAMADFESAILRVDANGQPVGGTPLIDYTGTPSAMPIPFPVDGADVAGIAATTSRIISTFRAPVGDDWQLRLATLDDPETLRAELLLGTLDRYFSALDMGMAARGDRVGIVWGGYAGVCPLHVAIVRDEAVVTRRSITDAAFGREIGWCGPCLCLTTRAISPGGYTVLALSPEDLRVVDAWESPVRRSWPIIAGHAGGATIVWSELDRDLRATVRFTSLHVRVSPPVPRGRTTTIFSGPQGPSAGRADEAGHLTPYDRIRPSRCRHGRCGRWAR